MLIHRVLTAIVAAPAILVAIWFGPPWITLLAGGAAAIGVWEAYRLFAQIEFRGDAMIGSRLPAALGGVWSVALTLGAELAATPYDFAIASATICAAGCIVAGLWIIAAWRGQRLIPAVAWLTLPPVYIGGGLACAVALRGFGQFTPSESWAWINIASPPSGVWWLLLGILSVYAADTTAFFVGRSIGRRRMAPRISPGKTWEGAAGGMAGSVIASVALGAGTPLGLEVWQAALTGVILGVVSPAGDLIESMVKRTAGVKDSGAIFPGHGGMLDRLDSLLPSFMVVYAMAVVWAARN